MNNTQPHNRLAGPAHLPWPSLALVAFALGAGLGGAPATAVAQQTQGDPAFIAIGGGLYDWNRQKDEGGEFRLEYRHDQFLFGLVKPFIAVAFTTTDSQFIGAGILMDIYLHPRLVVTPSFAPHYYNGGNTKLDLDYPLQFRSQLEIAYRFDDRSRLGIAVSHYSNASLGDTNPGTESATLYYAIPVSALK